MSEQLSRQSFLGQKSEEQIQRTIVGIVGLSGGGSHIVLQLRHLGFRRFRNFDPDNLECSNLNRVVTATPKDVGRAKVDIARDRILEFQPDAEVRDFKGYWQNNPDLLKECDVVFGCVDGFQQRHELEEFCRKNLIPLIDIGMDVQQQPEPGISGQVIRSMPGETCMWCTGFLTREILQREAERYGAAGINPQVVWPNGVLASLAVGMLVDLVTGWSKIKSPAYLMYDGKRGSVTPHPYLDRLGTCSHYPLPKVDDSNRGS